MSPTIKPKQFVESTLSSINIRIAAMIHSNRILYGSRSPSKVPVLIYQIAFEVFSLRHRPLL